MGTTINPYMMGLADEAKAPSHIMAHMPLSAAARMGP